MVRSRARLTLLPAPDLPGHSAPSAEDSYTDSMLRAEGQRAVRDGLAQLTPKHRELLELLGEPTLTYEKIGRRLGMPMGSIGPTRARNLRKLRKSAPIVRYEALLAG